MCVIAIKPQSIGLPPQERLLEMFTHNTDGAGFMYCRDGKVHIRKGFMKFRKLIAAIKHEKLTKEDTVVFHFRIGTSGSKSRKNTHPFPVSSKKSELEALSFETDLGMAHNGVLSYDEDKKADFSDTMTFIRDILSDKTIRDSLATNPAIFSLVEMAIGNSKFVFLDNDHDYALMGDWKKDEEANDGLLYSNLFFKFNKNVTVYHSTRYNNRHSANTWDEHEWDNYRSEITHNRGTITSSQIASFPEAVQIESTEMFCPMCLYEIGTERRIFCPKCGIILDRGDEYVV